MRSFAYDQTALETCGHLEQMRTACCTLLLDMLFAEEEGLLQGSEGDGAKLHLLDMRQAAPPTRKRQLETRQERLLPG